MTIKTVDDAPSAKAPEKGKAKPKLVFLHSILAQVSLPRKLTLGEEGMTFKASNGDYSIEITTGSLIDEASGIAVRQPFPYGPKLRLILGHVCSEIVRSRGKLVVRLGTSLRSFISGLGLDAGADNYKAVLTQLNSLAASKITMTSPNGSFDFGPFSELAIGSLEKPIMVSKDAKWPAQITVTQAFVNAVLKHPVPLDPVAWRKLASSALAMDVYSYLAYRLPKITKNVPLTWPMLADQFGGYGRAKDFKKSFEIALDAVDAVYPKMQVIKLHDCLILERSERSVAEIVPGEEQAGSGEQPHDPMKLFDDFVAKRGRARPVSGEAGDTPAASLIKQLLSQKRVIAPANEPAIERNSGPMIRRRRLASEAGRRAPGDGPAAA